MRPFSWCQRKWWCQSHAGLDKTIISATEFRFDDHYFSSNAADRRFPAALIQIWTTMQMSVVGSGIVTTILEYSHLVATTVGN
jgi:hypothetical protein